MPQALVLPPPCPTLMCAPQQLPRFVQCSNAPVNAYCDASRLFLTKRRARRAPMLHINGLTYRIGGRLLLEGASAALPDGHKIGLVGRNGSGKSTLLKLILGELSSEAGGIGLPRNARIGTVAQEAPGGEESLLDTVMAGDSERAALLHEAETATDPHRIADIQTR